MSRTDAKTQPPSPAAHSVTAKRLAPAAQRALSEAAARRAERERQAERRPAENNGPRGPDPVRYGDWEVKGIASDF